MEATSTITYLQYAILVLTAFIGIYGTIYEYKVDGKITKHAYRAISILVILCILAIVIESLKYNAEEQKAIAATKAAEEAEARVIAEQKALSTIKLDLEMSKAALQQAIAAMSDLNKASMESAKQLRILTTPFQYIGFAWGLRYDNAKVTFPKYHELLDNIARKCIEDWFENVCEEVSFDFKGDFDYGEDLDPESDLSDLIIRAKFYVGSGAFLYREHDFDGGLKFVPTKEKPNYDPLSYDPDKVLYMYDEKDKYLATRELVPWFGYAKWSENVFPAFHREFEIGFTGLAEPNTLTISNDMTAYERFKTYLKFHGHITKRTDLEFRSGSSYEPVTQRLQLPIDDEFEVSLELLPEKDAIVLNYNRPIMSINEDNLQINSIVEMLQPQRHDQHFIHIMQMLSHNPVMDYFDIHLSPTNSRRIHFDESQIIKWHVNPSCIEDICKGSTNHNWLISLDKKKSE